MGTFFIAPYEPTSDSSKWDSLKTASDLRIDVHDYRQRLKKRWPHAECYEDQFDRPLMWVLVDFVGSEKIPHGIGSLHIDYQIVSHDTPHVHFFLWHRSVIPKKYRLWLFDDTRWDSIELTPETTREDIESFWRHRQ